MAGTAAIALSTQEKLARSGSAAAQMAQLSTADKNSLLLRIAEALVLHEAEILCANTEDMERANLAGAMQDRLLLTPARIADMASAVREVAALPDPVDEVLEAWTRPNGLQIRKVRVPLGVVGIVYEARPNVTVDAATLALKAGNAVVLRGGKEAARSNQALAAIMSEVHGLPTGAIELLDSTTRNTVDELIRARGLVDVVIPRGGPALITHVMENALVPVIETGAGNCHIFVDESANPDMAAGIILNAKTQRPSVCNAAEKVVVHSHIARTFVPIIVEQLVKAGVEVRGDAETCRLAPDVKPATEADWGEEYLRLCIAIRVLPGLEAAIEHVNRYSTKHSEVIVTSSEANARRFLRLIDSAAVYWNASTRFTDGGEFGFGAEIGNSTARLHARGPVGLADITTTKYVVRGAGQIRE